MIEFNPYQSSCSFRLFKLNKENYLEWLENESNNLKGSYKFVINNSEFAIINQIIYITDEYDFNIFGYRQGSKFEFGIIKDKDNIMIFDESELKSKLENVITLALEENDEVEVTSVKNYSNPEFKLVGDKLYKFKKDNNHYPEEWNHGNKNWTND